MPPATLASPVLPFSPSPLLFAADLWRGPGFYLDMTAFLPVVVVYLLWVRTCWWVDRDARLLKLPVVLWNSVMLGCGLAGLLIVWLFPPGLFLLSFPILLLLYLGSSLVYVRVRNEGVDANRRVLTPRHLRDLGNRWLRLNFKAEDQEEDKGLIPLRFIGKSFGGREEDPTRVRRAQESRGYQAALKMVYEAIEQRATDIHLEPTKEDMAVRFRIDGILEAEEPFSRQMGESVVNIFKVLADLDITEKRKPQDGSFSAEAQERRKPKKKKEGEEDAEEEAQEPHMPQSRQIDFRVATAGSVAGEKMVMRILDSARNVANLKKLGMRPKMREQIHQLAVQPHGMLIVCGPTGAGKSTTLYACLQEIDRFQKNVITVENPVEYNIPNVTQIEVNPKAGKTFAGELRSILRQDPDVIYIGEIRDQETAEIACQAAQTGHMVFTTLHANDTVTAVARLVDLGVAPFTVASSVSAVLGQRLVRLLCPKCKRRYRPNPELLRKANLPADKIEYFYRPPPEAEGGDDAEGGGKKRCPYCGGSGYRGRTGVFELLVLNDRIRDLIRENPNPNAIRQEAVKNGMKYLQEDGLLQVIEGRTSIQELLRVCK
ncbi:MAG TPA: GspE/PulE family protein [Gemmataceae bacterium]|nr:GspE/PulE family protein [Gemmataceae bacterium]